MAATTGGLATSIRRKLQDGQTPEQIVQELVAGGLGQTSAQRFVDRALAKDASAPPLPPLAAPSESAPPGDALDQFIQTKSMETQAAEETVGRKTLWAGSALMCLGVGITGGSYIMADVGERFTLMWGPVAFGLVIWGKALIGGLANIRSFAWFSAMASLAAPVALSIVLLGVVAASEPAGQDQREPAGQDQRELAASEEPAFDQSLIPVVDAENLTEVMRDYDIASNHLEKCALADALSKFRGEGREWVGVELSNRIRKMPDRSAPVKICTASAVMTLDEATGVKLFEDWQQSDNTRLKNAAEVVLANYR